MEATQRAMEIIKAAQSQIECEDSLEADDAIRILIHAEQYVWENRNR